MAFKIEVVRKRLFIPLALAMTVFISGMIFTVYRLQWDHINNEAMMKVDAFHRNYQSQIQAETELLNGFLLFLEDDPMLRQAFLSGDRDALLRAATPVFQELRKRSLVTHLYFIADDKKCFLRVHKPESHGDLIDRTTMDIAAHIGKPATGVEMGPYGTVCLRVVHPWVINGRIAGYIELSEDVEQITARISRIMNVDMISVVDKKFLDRKNWEQGQRISGRTGKWDQYKDFVVVSGYTGRKKPELDTALASLRRGEEQFLLSSGGRVVTGGFDASIDAAGNNVGRFIIFSDVTREERNIYGLLLRLGAFTLVIAGLTLAFFDWYISRIHFRYAEPDGAGGGSGKEK